MDKDSKKRRQVGDEQNSVPGRGNSKCKDPGVTLFLACWKRVELKRSQGGESSRR